MARTTHEPFFWGLFSAGGALAAIVLPIHLLLFAVAVPLGWVEPPTYQHLYELAGHPVARMYLLALGSLPLFHWAHRFRFTLYDGLQIKHLNEVIFVLCYGGAVAGTLTALYLVLTFS